MSAKIRCLAVLAACFSCVFGVAAFGSPFLILGAIAQPGATTSGRWLMWTGALLLSIVVIPFGAGVVLQEASTSGKTGPLCVFAVDILLVLWCDVVLVRDALKAKRDPWVRGSLDWLVWLAAIALTAVCVWTGRVTVNGSKIGSGLRLDDLLFTVGLDAPVILFDLALTLHAVKTRRTG